MILGVRLWGQRGWAGISMREVIVLHVRFYIPRICGCQILAKNSQLPQNGNVVPFATRAPNGKGRHAVKWRLGAHFRRSFRCVKNPQHRASREIDTAMHSKGARLAKAAFIACIWRRLSHRHSGQSRFYIVNTRKLSYRP